jgi:predicted Rossmann-fold nucleotide-binding protein
MEAANLGAYLAEVSESAFGAALERLAEAPHYTDPGYQEAAKAVIKIHPKGCASLAIPTWFYGHEPSNQFSTYIAKYFSNSIREDGLLAIATCGVVYAPGSAGTTQEIFMDAAQNHYKTFHLASPMVFLGREHYEERTGIYPTLQRLAQNREYEAYLALTDDPEEVLAHLVKFRESLMDQGSSVSSSDLDEGAAP